MQGFSLGFDDFGTPPPPPRDTEPGDPEPGSGTRDCHCLHGMAYYDPETGECRCRSIREPFDWAYWWERMPVRVVHQYQQVPTPPLPPRTPTPTPGGAIDGDTIFGLPKTLVYIAGAGIGLYVLSSMEGDKKR